MQDLVKQEQFEMEVIEKLNSNRLLNKVIFCGGTMLRLCYGLTRFSVDLDFLIVKGVRVKTLFKDVYECLRKSYEIKDSANKFYTLLFEVKSNKYPRSLKIEIRKKIKKVKTEETIAFSKFSNLQVLLRTVTLEDMMKLKIESFLDRKEIRDVFDMEFILKKGIELNAAQKKLKLILTNIDKLKKQDYTVKLGSLLDADLRKYYIKQNFRILKMAINEKLK